MLWKKIVKCICCVFLWLNLVSIFQYIFETWSFFNQVTNTTIVSMLSWILAVVGCCGIILIVKWAWEEED